MLCCCQTGCIPGCIEELAELAELAEPGMLDYCFIQSTGKFANCLPQKGNIVYSSIADFIFLIRPVIGRTINAVVTIIVNIFRI